MHTVLERDIEASVARKVQRRILPLLIAGWFVAYIDRFNVGFAALQMNKAVGLSPATYGMGAGLFFLGYSVFEIPSNLLLERVGARRWLSRIMVTWGIVCLGMTAIRGAHSFNTLRLLLGVAEAGCFPGMAFYLTRWLPPRHRTDALAKLGSMAFVSGIVGAPMAAALLSLNGFLGLGGWQWLFVIEGAPAIAIGWCVLRYLPDRPDDVSWLTAEEKHWLRAELGGTQPRTTPLASLAAVAGDPRYWIWALVFFCISGSGTALRLWQPLILRDISGQTDTAAALLPAISSTIGAVVIVLVGRISMRTNERRWHVVVSAALLGVGLLLLGVAHSVGGVVLAAAVMALGSGAQPPLFALVSSASRGSTNAVGIAFVNALAGLGAFIGPSAWGYVLATSGSLMIGTAVSALVVFASAPLLLLIRDVDAGDAVNDAAVATP
jgi:MFS transporter, ACS family, tartrate transporter